MHAIRNEANKLLPQIIADRRYFHQNAEIGFDLPLTAAYVAKRLKEMGYDPQPCGKAGLVALAGGTKPGKVFLLRADMDALPIAEETGLPFRSATPYMHACGHDCHAAMLLGAAQLLKNYEDEIPGTVKLMFQPAEELISGARDMVQAGVLENPHVDAAAMIHIFSGLPAPAGTLMIPTGGYVSSSADAFHIEVEGKGGHGAMPNLSIDPLNAAAHILIALQELIAREIDPNSTAVITIGQMHGGKATNIIPDSAFLEGTIRAFNAEERAFLRQRVIDVAQGVAATFRATAKTEYILECPSVYSDPGLFELVCSANEALLGKEWVKTFAEAYPGGRMSGSEDFGYVSEKVPSVMMILGGGSPEEGYPYPQHHPKADFREDVFATGSAVLANTALAWLMANAS